MEQSAAAPSRQAAAAAKKKPTTLLDAYEVECIRRELQRLVLKHNQSAAGGDTRDTAPGHRNNVSAHLHHHRVSSAKKATRAKRVSPSPSPSASASLTPPPGPGPKNKDRCGARLLGRHAVAICGGTVPLAGGTTVGGRGRRAVAICSGTTAPVAGTLVGGGRGKECAVASCSGTTTAPVGCAAVGEDGRRWWPRGGYREVEKV